MDDIAIATKDLSLSLHEAAVSDVLQVAKDNSLFFKLSKSVFHAPAIDYLCKEVPPYARLGPMW